MKNYLELDHLVPKKCHMLTLPTNLPSNQAEVIIYIYIYIHIYIYYDSYTILVAPMRSRKAKEIADTWSSLFLISTSTIKLRAHSKIMC